ncbi:hypothetical protein C7R92_31215 [Brevibacillus porteri]|uniref:Uncharacterized protein n=1 Tax=Brevibacillus porteri TaxID=2126350 RepID=A0ABX5FFV1_9BACL|nr:hypothetical protein C7R92_31215 [Brevibacillus porteri]
MNARSWTTLEGSRVRSEATITFLLKSYYSNSLMKRKGTSFARSYWKASQQEKSEKTYTWEKEE